MKQTQDTSRGGQRAALVMAATGVFWICAIFLGNKLGLSMRIRALFDLLALAGFGVALYMTFKVWRARREDKDEG